MVFCGCFRRSKGAKDDRSKNAKAGSSRSREMEDDASKPAITPAASTAEGGTEDVPRRMQPLPAVGPTGRSPSLDSVPTTAIENLPTAESSLPTGEKPADQSAPQDAESVPRALLMGDQSTADEPPAPTLEDNQATANRTSIAKVKAAYAPIIATSVYQDELRKRLAGRGGSVDSDPIELEERAEE